MVSVLAVFLGWWSDAKIKQTWQKNKTNFAETAYFPMSYLHTYRQPG